VQILYLQTTFEAKVVGESKCPLCNFLSFFLAFLVVAETLGFETYPLPYLSPEATGNNLLIGASFASAGSGYFDQTSYLYVSIN
jgi:hypothetical protein